MRRVLATVATTSPLTVDIDHGATGVAVWVTLASGLAVGDRVLCDLEGNRLTVIGVAGGTGTSAPTPSAPMSRDAAGRAQVEAPSAAKDIVNKAYADSLVPTDSGWVTPTLAGGFTAGSPAPQVRRIGQVVYMRGVISGTFTAGSNIVCIAAGGIAAQFRPAVGTYVALGSNNTTNTVIRGVVGTDGSLTAITGTGAPTSVQLASSWLLG